MWLDGRRCPACGSRLLQWHFVEPHCFCCGFNHPDVAEEREWGGVWEILPRINSRRERVAMLPPRLTAVNGYMYETKSLRFGESPRVDKLESLRLRGFSGRVIIEREPVKSGS